MKQIFNNLQLGQSQDVRIRIVVNEKNIQRLVNAARSEVVLIYLVLIFKMNVFLSLWVFMKGTGKEGCQSKVKNEIITLFIGGNIISKKSNFLRNLLFLYPSNGTVVSMHWWLLCCKIPNYCMVLRSLIMYYCTKCVNSILRNKHLMICYSRGWVLWHEP